MRVLKNDVLYFHVVFSCYYFYRSSDWAIWPNYEVVELQPWSDIATVLDYVAYCHVSLPWHPCYYITHHSYHTRSFSPPGVARLRPRILTYCSASTIPLFPLPDPPPPPVASHYLITSPSQRLTKAASMTHTWVPPAPSPIISLLACTNFEYRTQRYTLCYGFLTSPYVGHFCVIFLVLYFHVIFLVLYFHFIFFCVLFSACRIFVLYFPHRIISIRYWCLDTHWNSRGD